MSGGASAAGLERRRPGRSRVHWGGHRSAIRGWGNGSRGEHHHHPGDARTGRIGIHPGWRKLKKRRRWRALHLVRRYPLPHPRSTSAGAWLRPDPRGRAHCVPCGGMCRRSSPISRPQLRAERIKINAFSFIAIVAFVSNKCYENRTEKEKSHARPGSQSGGLPRA